MSRAGIIAVVLFAAVLHFYRLDQVPVYVSTDEARFAVQAHSLATTGRDLRGNRLPMFVLIVDPFSPKEQSPAWWNRRSSTRWPRHSASPAYRNGRLACRSRAWPSSTSG